MEIKNIIDISPQISPRLAVFPGDKVFERNISLDMHHGDILTLSSINTTLHLGAHADAPSHYHKKGASIEHRKLEAYLGPCQVIQVQNLKKKKRIYPKDIEDVSIQAPRVLLSTSSYEPELWNDDFNSLSPGLIEYLHKKKVILVGIDTPSVDPSDSKTLESHQALAKFDLSVLEGLVLQHVPPGLYFLSALPLKLEGADASPVRAVLFSVKS